jgi:hypothetical protein
MREGEEEGEERQSAEEKRNVRMDTHTLSLSTYLTLCVVDKLHSACTTITHCTSRVYSILTHSMSQCLIDSGLQQQTPHSSPDVLCCVVSWREEENTYPRCLFDHFLMTTLK